MSIRACGQEDHIDVEYIDDLGIITSVESPRYACGQALGPQRNPVMLLQVAMIIALTKASISRRPTFPRVVAVAVAVGIGSGRCGW